MKISASIIADSVNPRGIRLTTAMLTYPRIIHSEFMTHRGFSRNAASSRAIPIERMLAAVSDDPAWPEHWGTNKPGMQAGEPLSAEDADSARGILDGLRQEAIHCVSVASEVCNLHKQVANRYLEPWGWITVIATAADWCFANFFNLRASPMADPTFQVLAYRLLAAYMASKPQEMDWNDWHIPFAAPQEKWSGFGEETMDVVKQAVGRCARVSYLRHEDDPAKNRELHDRLAAASPMHASAFEHVAQAAVNQDHVSNFDFLDWSPHRAGSGWEQYRKTFPFENRTILNAEALMADKPEWLTL